MGRFEQAQAVRVRRTAGARACESSKRPAQDVDGQGDGGLGVITRVEGRPYPQYLVLLMPWETNDLSVKALGVSLELDYGTLAPPFKRLVTAGLLTSRAPRGRRTHRLDHPHR
jgi:hypothetical protein